MALGRQTSNRNCSSGISASSEFEGEESADLYKLRFDIIDKIDETRVAKHDMIGSDSYKLAIFLM